MEAESVRTTVRASPTRCPFCHDQVDTVAELWVACAECLSRHHAPCWDESGACGSCQSQRRLVASHDEMPDSKTLRALLKTGRIDEATALLTRAGSSREQALEHLLRLVLEAEESPGLGLFFVIPHFVEAAGLAVAGLICVVENPEAGWFFFGSPYIALVTLFWLVVTISRGASLGGGRAFLSILWQLAIIAATAISIEVFDIRDHDSVRGAILFGVAGLFAFLRAHTGLKILRESRAEASSVSKAQETRAAVGGAKSVGSEIARAKLAGADSAKSV